MKRQLVLCSIDGLRPDAIAVAQTPVLDHLISRGAHTLAATTVMPSVTLPCHTSLFTGVPPDMHGVVENIWQTPPAGTVSLLDLLKQSGLTTAAFYNWEELRDLAPPGSLDVSFMVKDNHFDGRADTAVADMAAAWLGSNEFDFAFLYLVGVDHAGHQYGWMSDQYLQAVEHADACLGRVLDAVGDGCAVIVTSDHGGHGTDHGTDCAEDMTTPIIMVGGAAGAGAILPLGARITDIAPTVVDYFGLGRPDGWVGRTLVGTG